MRRNHKVYILGGVILASTVALTGCVAEASPPTSSATPSKTSTTSASPIASKTPTSSGTPTSEPLVAEKMDRSCEEIFPLDRLYEFDSNLGLIPGQTPTVSSSANAQLALEGITCALTNLSSGATTEVIVTKLTEKSAAAKKKELDSVATQGSYQVETGLTAAFAGQTGQFVKNTYLVSVASTDFASAVDASRISYLTAQGL